jgi:hypothetical protein
MEQTVMVWGMQQVVSVYQQSKTARIATGDYMGERIEVRARTESAAIARCLEAIRYKGNSRCEVHHIILSFVYVIASITGSNRQNTRIESSLKGFIGSSCLFWHGLATRHRPWYLLFVSSKTA